MEVMSESKEAFSRITSDFPQPLKEEFFNLWMEYEEQRTPASHYVFDFDKLDMLIQADSYERGSSMCLSYHRSRKGFTGIFRFHRKSFQNALWEECNL